MTRMRMIAAVVGFVLAGASSAFAQQQAALPPEPMAVFAVGGVLSQQIVKAPEHPGSFGSTGPTLGFQYRTARSGAAAFVFEIAAQLLPAHVRYPQYEDQLSPFYMLGGAEFGRRKYVRISAGFSTIDDMVPMVGVAAGFNSGQGVLTGAEFIVRACGRPHAMGILAGVQVRFGRHVEDR